MERVALVGVRNPRESEWIVNDSVDELGQLTATAGGKVVGRFICKQLSPHPRYYIGSGKAQELADWIEEHDVDTVIFDDDLSPAQGRNLEKILERKVIDRTQVILDIFAQHATTRDGQLQIELARMEYLLPRLKRMWTHLERQRGGIGLRGGPGEQQIEVDRRRIQERIARLRDELRKVRRHRAEVRKGRRRHGWALVSVVGYTNAGKSTLINAVTEAEVKTNDQLFVTLDPTTRKIRLPNHQHALVTDTVGFIKKLPHHLVEAFKATLEEVVEADLLVHVIDASHEHADRQIEAVEGVLRELEAHRKPVLAVLNKTDVESGALQWQTLARGFERSVAISALKRRGLDDFREALADCLRHRNTPVELEIPMSEAKLIATLKGEGNVLEERYEPEHVYMQVRVPDRLLHQCEPYLMDKEPSGA